MLAGGVCIVQVFIVAKVEIVRCQPTRQGDERAFMSTLCSENILLVDVLPYSSSCLVPITSYCASLPPRNQGWGIYDRRYGNKQITNAREMDIMREICCAPTTLR